MFELEKFGQYFGKRKPQSYREKFELIDGIKFGQTRMITATNDEPLFSVSLSAALPSIEGINPDTIFRVLLTYFPDGTVKELLIDFSEPYLEWQLPDASVGFWGQKL